MDRAQEVYASGQISEGHYKTYLLFEANELGREWLKKMGDSIMRERIPHGIGEHAYAVHHGRLSLLQDIFQMIDQTKQVMERKDDDERRAKDRGY